MIAYLTDVEGRWDKIESFTEKNPHVWLDDSALRLADGVTFVFGGDAIDRGPHGRRVVELLLRARADYGERVVLLAGNRDINKLRLWRELDGEPPRGTPPEVLARGRGALLQWIFAATMGAKEAFAHRARELEAEGRDAGDEAVVQSFLDDLAPNGALRRYLGECRLAFRAGATLFVHGGVTAENLGVVPGEDERIPDVDGWLDRLNQFYRSEMSAFVSGRVPRALIAYQAPLPGTHRNQASVVYARLADHHANPCLPSEDVIARLRASGVRRVVVGHTPSGDCPAVLRDGDFELVMADNSYGRVEHGSQLFLTDAEARVAATTELDDGRRVAVRFTSDWADHNIPLGRRDGGTNRLVKARLETGDYLLFRGLPGYRVEQTTARADEIASWPLVAAR